MKTNKIFMIWTYLLSLLLIATFSWAAEEKVALKAGPDGKGASGNVVITDAGTGQKEITITVSGLKPQEVYTAWFVNMKPKMDMAGIGKPDYVIRVDENGNGTYTAKVSADELAKWQMIEIARHKSGDPKDMKKLGITLTGKLPSVG